MTEGSPIETFGRGEMAEARPSAGEDRPDGRALDALAVLDARVARLREILAGSEVRAARIAELLNGRPGGPQNEGSGPRLARSPGAG